MLGPDRADDPVVQRRGEPRLLVGRKPVDLVEHQRACVAMLERTHLALESSGERAFFVPEQRGFNRVDRYACDIDEAEGRTGARAGGVDGAQQHFLAGAAFAFDQNMRMCARGLGGAGKRDAECGIGADHRIEI